MSAPLEAQYLRFAGWIGLLAIPLLECHQIFIMVMASAIRVMWTWCKTMGLSSVSNVQRPHHSAPLCGRVRSTALVFKVETEALHLYGPTKLINVRINWEPWQFQSSRECLSAVPAFDSTWFEIFSKIFSFSVDWMDGDVHHFSGRDWPLAHLAGCLTPRGGVVGLSTSSQNVSLSYFR